jgi:exonuclease SbcC
MKILELRFKNLNSLYGEWFIDFTAPEYAGSGIFALTGPTGAGKSTILDAICLALYGSTPRLGKITKSGNEIMSRQTGECFAEVMFESQAGRFRCNWGQHRARKKPDGRLADARHEISDVETKKTIETKKSRVSTVIEEKTGMDFERFTRSILLAQGGFDTFLKADAEQKSRILEQITGTEIYSEISRRVHERKNDEKKKLEILQAEISGIVILEPEQEQETQQELQVKQQQEAELAGKTTETGTAIAWLTSVETLKKEISTLSEETVMLQSEIETFKPQRDKLERALKAASLAGSYATLIAIRKQQSDDQAALKAEETALPELETAADAQAELLKSAEQQVCKAKDELTAAAPFIQKIRLLDQKLAEQKKAVSEDDESCRKDAARIAADKKIRLKEQEKRADAEKSLEYSERYFNEHAQDEWLISGLTGVEEQLGNLLSQQKEIAQHEANIRKADRALHKAIKKHNDRTKDSSIHKQERANASKRLQQGKDALSSLLGGLLLREYRKEKETLLLQMAYLKKIEELEEHRARLEDGRPCPLCGSKEHPFAEGNVPIADETEEKIESLTRLITRAEELESANKKLEEAQSIAGKNLTDSEKLEATSLGEKTAAEKTLAELRDGLDKLRAGFNKLKQAVSAKLRPLGITEIPDGDVSSLLKSLKSRLGEWQDQVRKKGEIEKQIADIYSEMKRLNAVIETQGTALAEKQKRLQALEKEHAAGSEERKELYGDKNPDDEERRLNKTIADAEEAEKKARSLNSGLQQKLTTARTHVESLRKRIVKREPELEKVQNHFLSALEPAGFSSEKQFLEARLTNEERDALSARAKGLDDGQTDLKARQKDREIRLEAELAKNVTDKTLEELEPQFKEYEESLKELRNTIAGLTHRLRENGAARERVKEKQGAVEAQKKECRRWENLHGLIGSADGKKYRNFAQGLTFELMVSHANRQLEKMTDRYLLIRDDGQPLELNVIDNYQAGEIRSTRNLSGGESFIVSLTLALGLSKMASRKVRVDSLFLDEGFGTLDEEALETALETLSGLQQGGKLIGIISHVSALKERISTQITITPVSGGRSSLAGPGCSKM